MTSDLKNLNFFQIFVLRHRYDPPKGNVDFKLLFKGNIIKPKSWSKSFSVVCDTGGFNETCELEVHVQ